MHEGEWFLGGVVVAFLAFPAGGQCAGPRVRDELPVVVVGVASGAFGHVYPFFVGVDGLDVHVQGQGVGFRPGADGFVVEAGVLAVGDDRVRVDAGGEHDEGAVGFEDAVGLLHGVVDEGVPLLFGQVVPLLVLDAGVGEEAVAVGWVGAVFDHVGEIVGRVGEQEGDGVVGDGLEGLDGVHGGDGVGGLVHAEGVCVCWWGDAYVAGMDGVDLRGALCARPEVTGLPADAWFAFGDDPLQGRAREVCARCPVRGVCLELALANREPYGVWGGLDERERQGLLRERMRERRGRMVARDAWRGV